MGLGDYFTCVLGPEDVGQRAKPDPAMLIEGLNRLKVSANETVFVGEFEVKDSVTSDPRVSRR